MVGLHCGTIMNNWVVPDARGYTSVLPGSCYLQGTHREVIQ